MQKEEKLEGSYCLSLLFHPLLHNHHSGVGPPLSRMQYLHLGPQIFVDCTVEISVKSLVVFEREVMEGMGVVLEQRMGLG
jgi:hypothetical protein